MTKGLSVSLFEKLKAEEEGAVKVIDPFLVSYRFY
jgi:hypothetical protein